MKSIFNLLILFAISVNIYGQSTGLIISKDPIENSKINIVVLGSSTAAGVGPSSKDSSWVNKFRSIINASDTNISVINLAVSGYSTFDIMPNNFITQPNRPTPKPNNNLTKALEYNPKAIIINLPSNDASSGYGVDEQINNYRIIFSITDSLGIPVWGTTPQPRNFSEEKIKMQFEMIDSTYSLFKEMTIDYWTDFADSNGRINPMYNSGDGIHLNDSAHSLMLKRITEKNVTPNYFNAVTNFSDSTLNFIKIDFSVFSAGYYSIKLFKNWDEEIETILSEHLEAGNYSLTYYLQNNSGEKFIIKLFSLDSLINHKEIDFEKELIDVVNGKGRY